MKEQSLGARLRHLDLYALLEVSPEAGFEEIRRAYRRAAFRCHPDRHPHDQEAAQRFVLLTQARDVLLNEQARMTYDQMCDKYGVNQAEAVAAEEGVGRQRRRGTRRTSTNDPLREHRLADRAQRSRSAAELTTLWQIGSVVVRAAVIRNVACPHVLLSDPQIESHWMLSLEAANRAQCPPAMLRKLASSFERSVALAVALHPATPSDALSTIAVHHRDLEVLSAIAAHANATAEALRDIGRAVRGPRSVSLGAMVLAHPACPPDVAQRIRARLGDMVA